MKTTQSNEFATVRLLQDEPKFNLKAGLILQCQIHKFAIGNGYQIFTELGRIESQPDSSVKRTQQEPFHASFKTEEEFNQRFELIEGQK